MPLGAASHASHNAELLGVLCTRIWSEVRPVTEPRYRRRRWMPRGGEKVRTSAGPGTSPSSEETRQPRWGHDNGGYQRDHLPSQQEVSDIAEKWRPYRTLATFYLYSAKFRPAAESQASGDAEEKA